MSNISFNNENNDKLAFSKFPLEKNNNKDSVFEKTNVNKTIKIANSAIKEIKQKDELSNKFEIDNNDLLYDKEINIISKEDINTQDSIINKILLSGYFIEILDESNDSNNVLLEKIDQKILDRISSSKTGLNELNGRLVIVGKDGDITSIKASKEGHRLLDGKTIHTKDSDGTVRRLDSEKITIKVMSDSEYQRFYQIFTRLIFEINQRLAEEMKKLDQQTDGHEPALLNRTSKLDDVSKIDVKDREKISIIFLLSSNTIKNFFHRLTVEKEKDKKIRDEKKEEFRQEMKKNYQIEEQKKEELKVRASNENIENINAKKITLIKGKHK